MFYCFIYSHILTYPHTYTPTYTLKLAVYPITPDTSCTVWPTCVIVRYTYTRSVDVLPSRHA